MVLDVPNVSRAIKDMFKGKAENLPTPALIVSEVCQYYNIEEQVGSCPLSRATER